MIRVCGEHGVTTMETDKRDSSLSSVFIIMPSQHGAKLWVTKETKRLARKSAEIVKDAIPQSQKSTAASPPLADSPIVSDIMIPVELQKGTMMTKISQEGEKKIGLVPA